MKFLRKRLFRLGLSLVLVLAVILGTSIDIGPSVKGSNGIVSLSVNTAVAATPQEGPKPYRPPPQPIIKGEVVNPKPLAYTTTLTDSPTANTGGNWTNPTYAYASDTNYATQNSNGGYNTYGTYGNNITSGNVVTQVRVRADAFENNHASSQSKAITGNDANTGGFTFTGGASLWESLNDASDATYDTGVTNGGGYCTVAFTAFSIPAGSVITNLALHYRHRSATTGTACNSGTVIKVNGTYYGLGGTLNAYTDNGTSSEPGSGSAIADRTYNWTKNPNTGATWTVADINGTGSAPLQFIGVGGSDFNPDVNFYKLDATVNYTSAPDDAIRLTVSWDGGTSWSANQSSTLSTSKATYWDNFTSATTWTRAKVNDTNFKVRVDSTTTGDVDTISLDWLPAEVTYDAIGAPTSFTSTSRTSGSIALSWTKGANADNTSVRYRTDVYPTGTGDGTSAYDGTGTSVNVTGLSAGQVYYFRAWSYNNTEAEYSSSYAQLTDYTLPADPSNLASSGVGDNNIVYSWTKGTGGDKTLLRYKTGSFPSSTSDGTQAYFDTGTSTNVTGLVVGTTYYFRAWAYDSDSTYYSSGTSDNIQATTGVAWLSGYQYRRELPINGSSGAGTGYSVFLRTFFDKYYITADGGGYAPLGSSLNNPVSAYYNGYTYVVYQGRTTTGDSDPYIVRYNHSTGLWDAPVKVGTNPLAAGDSHGAPIVLIRTDAGHVGKIVVLWGGHGAFWGQWSESTSAENITSWAAQANCFQGSFPKVVQVSNGDIYVFYRNYNGVGEGRDWAFRKMTSGGSTWSGEVTMLNFTDAGDAGDEPHLAMSQDSYDSANNKIWFDFSYYKTSTGQDIDQYVFAYSPTDNKTYDIAGNSLTLANSTQANFNSGSYKFKAFTNSAGDQSRPGAIAIDASGYAHVILLVVSGGSNYYKSFEWNGASWTAPVTITTAVTLLNPTFCDNPAFILTSTSDMDVYLSVLNGDLEQWHYDGANWGVVRTVLAMSGEPAVVGSALGQSSVPWNFASGLSLFFDSMDLTASNCNKRVYSSNGTNLIEFKAAGFTTLGGDVQADFDDVRFTDNDGVTQLSYSLLAPEGGVYPVKVDSNEANFVIKVNDDLSSNQSIYIYYGKAGDTYGGDISLATMFGDDFELNNFSRWTSAGNRWSENTTTVKNSTYSAFGLGGDATTNAQLLKTLTITGTFIVHYWARFNDGTSYGMYQANTQTTDKYPISVGGNANNHVNYYDTGYKEFSPAITYAANKWYELIFFVDLPNHQFSLRWNDAFSVSNTAQVTSVFTTANLTNLQLWSYNSSGKNVYLDDVYIRKWVASEPTWGTPGGETPFVQVTNAPASKDFGVVNPSSSYYAKGSAPSNPVVNGDCTFTITNTGVSAINTSIKGNNFTGGVGWTLTSGSAGSNTVRITAYYSGQNPASGVVLTTTNQNFYQGLTASSTIMWDFELETGTFTDAEPKVGQITITASAA